MLWVPAFEGCRSDDVPVGPGIVTRDCGSEWRRAAHQPHGPRAVGVLPQDVSFAIAVEVAGADGSGLVSKFDCAPWRYRSKTVDSAGTRNASTSPLGVTPDCAGVDR